MQPAHLRLAKYLPRVVVRHTGRAEPRVKEFGGGGRRAEQVSAAVVQLFEQEGGVATPLKRAPNANWRRSDAFLGGWALQVALPQVIVAATNAIAAAAPAVPCVGVGRGGHIQDGVRLDASQHGHHIRN